MNWDIEIYPFDTAAVVAALFWHRLFPLRFMTIEVFSIGLDRVGSVLPLVWRSSSILIISDRSWKWKVFIFCCLYYFLVHFEKNRLWRTVHRQRGYQRRFSLWNVLKLQGNCSLFHSFNFTSYAVAPYTWSDKRNCFKSRNERHYLHFITNLLDDGIITLWNYYGSWLRAP